MALSATHTSLGTKEYLMGMLDGKVAFITGAAGIDFFAGQHEDDDAVICVCIFFGSDAQARNLGAANG